jgi:hypothetical protein
MGHFAFFAVKRVFVSITHKTNRQDWAVFGTAMGGGARIHPTGGGQGIRIRFVKKIKNEYLLRVTGTEQGVYWVLSAGC